MKKFLSVMLLVVGIVLGSQLANVQTARAEYLVYCFSSGGDDYYIDLDNSLSVTTTGFYSETTIVIFTAQIGGGSQTIWGVAQMNLTPSRNQYYLSTSGGYKETGLISQNPMAQAVYKIITDPHTTRIRKERARARAEQKRRKEEEKRRKEEERKNKFNSLIAAGDQAYVAGDYAAAIKNYKNAYDLAEIQSTNLSKNWSKTAIT